MINNMLTHGTTGEESMGASLPSGTATPGLGQGGRPQRAHILSISSVLRRSSADVFVSTPMPSVAQPTQHSTEPSMLPGPASSTVSSLHAHADASSQPFSSSAEPTYVLDGSLIACGTDAMPASPSHIGAADCMLALTECGSDSVPSLAVPPFAASATVPYMRSCPAAAPTLRLDQRPAAAHVGQGHVDSGLPAAAIPFRDRSGEVGRSALQAFHLFIAIILALGSSGCLGHESADYELSLSRHLSTSVAAIYGAVHTFAHASLLDRWLFLSALANSCHPSFVFHGAFERHHGVGDPGATHAHVLSGAIAWLRCRSAVERPPQLMAGDWSLTDIFRRWPPDVATELSSFAWPIGTVDEFRRLLRCRSASPVAIMGCEFTAAVREAYAAAHGRVAISVDSRSSLVPGPHAVLDLTEVMWLKVWHDAYLFPPCTHQVLSDTRSGRTKRLDGRTFWGIAFFLYCWSVVAHRVRVEQPNTIIPEFLFGPSQRLRPCDAGDADSKPINLYERGWGRLQLLSTPAEALSGHRSLRDFEDADARDRWRSSWARFPCLCALIVALSQEQLSLDGALHHCWRRAGGKGDPCDGEDPEAVWGVAPPADITPSFLTLMETLAVAWYLAGYPVPADYLNGKPSSTSDDQRAYQSRRGAGDGRRVVGVVPVSLRTGSAALDGRLAILDGTPRGQSYLASPQDPWTLS